MRRSFRGRRRERRVHDSRDSGDAMPQEMPVGAWDEENALAEGTGLTAEDAGPDREFEPFVPVEAGAFRQYGDEETEPVTYEHQRRRRGLPLPRLRLPRLRLPRLRTPRIGVEMRGGILLVVVMLIAAGVFGTLLVQGTLRDSVEGWWPLAIIVGALLWMLLSLVQRRVTSFLGAWALAGVGLSALLDTQSIASAQDTVLGVVLVTVGLGIAFRGFLLRQQPAS